MKKITRAIIAASAAAALLTGCSNEADTASEAIVPDVNLETSGN